MNTEERSMIARECMSTLSDRLRELSNLMNTVHLGLMGEDIEQQVLDCTMCFLRSVNELHEFTELEHRMRADKGIYILTPNCFR